MTWIIGIEPKLLWLSFDGALFDGNKNVLNIEFSLPHSFINKYGEQAVLDEIETSVVGHIKTEPK